MPPIIQRTTQNYTLTYYLHQYLTLMPQNYKTLVNKKNV
nr:MAG TPA: hypothetical protein [Caudoviricetes sp.]